MFVSLVFQNDSQGRGRSKKKTEKKVKSFVSVRALSSVVVSPRLTNQRREGK